MSPPYRIPYTLLAPRIPTFLAGQRRSLAADVRRLFSSIDHAPRVVGADCIPEREAFLVVMNHFHRSDIPAWWSAIALLMAVAEARAGHAPNELRMIIASQWTYESGWQRALVEPLTRFMIGRIARAYNFVTIEPVVLGVSRTEARAQSIRRVLEAARQALRAQQPLGLAPEGGDSPDGQLMRPPVGAGRFMHLLASVGLPFLPVGIFADGDRLVTSFGCPFVLRTPSGLDKSGLDEWTSRQIMQRIARQLPERLHGTYREPS